MPINADNDNLYWVVLFSGNDKRQQIICAFDWHLFAAQNVEVPHVILYVYAGR